MPREGLPFKTIEEPKPLDEGGVSDVFEFTPEKGKEYVYKEVRPGTRVFWYHHGENLGETAAVMNKTYQILKRHLGDYLVTTHFLLAENKEGKPCIMMAQEKTRGEMVMDFGELTPNIRKQISEIMQLLRKAGKDPELAELAEAGKISLEGSSKYSFKEVLFRKNLIVDEMGRIRVVDW